MKIQKKIAKWSHRKMDYLNLEKIYKQISRSKLIYASKINFIYILYSGNKVDIDYKDNVSASKIWLSSWIVQESLKCLSQEELCSIFLTKISECP